MKRTREKIERITGKMGEGKIIIGGDLNAKMGREGPFFNEERKEFERRNSKDKVKNTEGTKLIEMVEENGWEILNGNTKGDEAGEFTCIGGKGNSVIDYIMIDPLMKDKIKSFRIEDRVESDHLPMVMEVYGRTEKEKKKEEQWKEKRVWTEEGKRHYQEEVQKMDFEREEPNELMEEMTRGIRKATLRKTIEIEERKIGWTKWWKRNVQKEKEKREKL